LAQAQKGSWFEMSQTCLMTGTELPGMRLRKALSSGNGSACSRERTCVGMVDQRFDIIDRGSFAACGARAYFQRPSVM